MGGPAPTLRPSGRSPAGSRGGQMRSYPHTTLAMALLAAGWIGTTATGAMAEEHHGDADKAATAAAAAAAVACGWRAALGGIGLVLPAGLVVGYEPALMGVGIDADRFLLGLTLLLCGGVPAVMALAQEKRARPRAIGRPLPAPPPRRRRAHTGASP